MADLDRRGIPGVMVATEAFKEAAAAQSGSIGFEPAIVWVPHPIQDRTDDEIRVIADDAMDAILAALRPST